MKKRKEKKNVAWTIIAMMWGRWANFKQSMIHCLGSMFHSLCKFIIDLIPTALKPMLFSLKLIVNCQA